MEDWERKRILPFNELNEANHKTPELVNFTINAQHIYTVFLVTRVKEKVNSLITGNDFFKEVLQIILEISLKKS